MKKIFTFALLIASLLSIALIQAAGAESWRDFQLASDQPVHHAVDLWNDGDRGGSISLSLDPSNVVSYVTTNETQQTYFDAFLKGLGGVITNVSVDPYLTYAPSAPDGAKVGGGLFVAYNFNSYAAAGIALDWLGQFALVSADVQFQAPFHLSTVLPAAANIEWLQNVEIVPFTILGLATPYSGNGHFNGAPMAVSDVGGYVAFGHLWGGQFNAGAAWGKWSGPGIYGGVTRYHAFFGYMKTF